MDYMRLHIPTHGVKKLTKPTPKTENRRFVYNCFLENRGKQKDADTHHKNTVFPHVFFRFPHALVNNFLLQFCKTLCSMMSVLGRSRWVFSQIWRISHHDVLPQASPLSWTMRQGLLGKATRPTGLSNTAYWTKQPQPNSQRSELQTGNSLDAEGFLGGVDVSQTKVDVGADALHCFHGEAATQVVGEGTRRRQPKAVPVGQRKATPVILCNACQHTPLTLFSQTPANTPLTLFSQTPANTHHASL